MKLKVCGMKYIDNINAVAKLQPDYLGFIFYGKSSRFFDSEIPEISSEIKKVGVFVNAGLEYIVKTINTHNLHGIQLHGQESPGFINNLKQMILGSEINNLEIVKVFSMKDHFDFSVLKAYEDICDYFLFDTKGKLPGGNGYTFNWDVLNSYPSTKPYFLSGGIGPNEIKKLKHFKRTDAAKYCHAIDVNSKFEIEAGLKNTNELEKFIYELQH